MAPQGGPGRGRSRRSSRRRRAPADQRKERRAKGRRHRSSFAPAVGMGSTDRLAAACQGQRSVALDRRPDQQRRRKVAMVLTFSIDGACYRSLRRLSVLLSIFRATSGPWAAASSPPEGIAVSAGWNRSSWRPLLSFLPCASKSLSVERADNNVLRVEVNENRMQ